MILKFVFCFFFVLKKNNINKASSKLTNKKEDSKLEIKKETSQHITQI